MADAVGARASNFPGNDRERGNSVTSNRWRDGDGCVALHDLRATRLILAPGSGEASGGTDHEPEGVAAEASKESAAFSGGDGCVAFAGESGKLDGFVG
jgi:hypothetical protein